MTHTPGPWSEHIMTTRQNGRVQLLATHVNGEVFAHATFYFGSGEKRIGELMLQTSSGGFGSVSNIDELEANGRLVIASPEMLAALKRAEPVLAAIGPSELLDEVRRVIGLAEGTLVLEERAA